ncbi:MAG TPA: DUF3619 family protein [Usitatibacter sp.]|jgi:hypothetical protein|nr:DUF3619 family protein [Usitatibacter sp.]
MNEKEFGQKLKPWLERSAQALGQIEETRLKAARLRALDAYREPVRLFGLVPMSAGTAQTIHYSFVQRALLFLPLAALLAALALQALPDADPGDLDAQLLSQELPPDAYLDPDFRQWLNKQQP